jgi:membrane protease subunit HflC
MTLKRKIVTAILVFVALIVLYAAAFTVREGEQVVIVRFGEVQRLVAEPGLHFKAPFIDDPQRFEKRWLEWDGEPTQITTADKRFISIDIFARWRISDPLVYIAKIGTEERAHSRLDDIIDSAARTVVANHNLIEVIRSTNREYAVSDEERLASGAGLTPAPSTAPPVAPEAPEAANTDGGVPEEAPAAGAAPNAASPAPIESPTASEMREELSVKITAGRKKLTQLILEKVATELTSLGVEVKDVQFKRIDYVESVQAKVFDRMISERRRVAEAFRSQGQGQSAEILGKKERELKTIRSEAYRQAQEVRGRADGEAAAIYADAYKADPEFYRFLKTLESYEQTIDENTWLLLTTDSDYSKHFATMR